jgi:hypothetical protein
MTDEPGDDDVPILRDLVRHGRKKLPAGAETDDRRGLSPAEIEAIAARVVAEHVPLMEQGVARALREALAARSPELDSEPDDSDDGIA